MSKQVTIIGAGSFASAIAQIFSDKKIKVLIYTRDEEQAKEINESNTNKRYFKDLFFSTTVRATTSLSDALCFSKYIVVAVPSNAVREISMYINKEVKEPKIFINVAKGLEIGTNKMMSEIIEEEIDKTKRIGVVILSGPSYAEEIIERQFTALVCASRSSLLRAEVEELFSNRYISLSTSSDITGVQLGASIKNILAVASGIIHGMGCGDNTRALLITRGLEEMVRYGVSKGAKARTFYGLSGIGDLIVTATSFHSRNFQVGYKIGKGVEAKSAIEQSKTVVEAVKTVKAVYYDAKKNNIDMPITEGIYKVFYEGLNPKQIMVTMIKEELKPEQIEI